MLKRDSEAAKLRPLFKHVWSPMLATSGVAVCGPIASTRISRRAGSLASASARIWRSYAVTRASKS